jgi:N-acetylglucosaminyldiphosphoundecaprenol N-acetyl-beta-D-mannosaminyltransferase
LVSPELTASIYLVEILLHGPISTPSTIFLPLADPPEAETINPMKTKTLNKLLSVAPLLLFNVIFLGLLLIRLMFNMVLPWWGAWGVGLCWAIMAFDYLLRAELFKQIGGFAVMLIAVLILIGALVPQDQVTRYPQVTSEQMVTGLETVWSAVYQGNMFEKYSPKQQLIDYATFLGNLNPFRHGKMILFGLLGFALAVVFLFPLEPSGKRGRGQGAPKSRGVKDTWRMEDGERRAEEECLSSVIRHRSSGTHRGVAAYAKRFALLLGAGAVFALQMELLQVLSPTRMVTGLSILDSCLGVLAGLLLFIPLHGFYLWLAERRAKGARRFNILGVGVDAVCMGDCLRRFEGIIAGKLLNVERGMWDDGGAGEEKHSTSNILQSTEGDGHRPVMTSALGVAGIIEARRNSKLQRILNESVLNTPDGMPLVWLGKLFGYRNIERVYGPDLLRDVCAYGVSRGWKHFFYGAAPGIVEKLKETLEKKHPDIQIAGIYCPPFRPLTPEEEDALVEKVNISGADIFWIGISTPKQLYFMDQMRDLLDCKIICPVGYAFDVNAGVEQDAPDWAKYSGFQWLHRAINQPRLWKRYLPDNPRFVFEVVLQILHLKKYPMFVHERPMKPFADAEGYPRFPAGVVSLSAMTLQSARDRVLNWVATGQKHYVNICTADTMVQCFDRPEMARIVNAAGMATTDGMPLVWLAHHYGFKEATRVYGPDLMLELCKATSGVDGCPLMVDKDFQATQQLNSATTDPALPGTSTTPQLNNSATDKKSVSHFFYGATDEVLAQLKANLLKKFPDVQIAGMYSPPFRPLTDAEKDDVAEMINASGADIVWCGLGTPKQDYWVAEFRPRLNCAAILAVGAAFNFHAGHVVQAPRWMMKSGLEWLFRLGTEPRRIWLRYLIGNPRFILLTWRQFLSRRNR